MAFITGDLEHSLRTDSLWLANLDGSGELRLHDKVWREESWQRGIAQRVHWSPDGRWLSYVRNNGLWLAGLDGAVPTKIYQADSAQGDQLSFTWSPDSTRIALIQRNIVDRPDPVYLRLLDAQTGLQAGLVTFETGHPVYVAWSPNGSKITYTDGWNINVIDSQTLQKIVSLYTGESPCGDDFHNLIWSRTEQWIIHSHYGIGRTWICVRALTGQTAYIQVEGYSVGYAWDSTGRFVYLVAINVALGNPNPRPDPRLLRIDAETQTLERLLSFDQLPDPSKLQVSISPDGNRLAILHPTWVKIIELDSLAMSDTPCLAKHAAHLPGLQTANS